MPAAKTDLAIASKLLDTLPPIIRAIRSAMRAYRGARFTVPQFRVLGFVSLQPCTSAQLAEWQGVSLPAMSRMVNHLVRRKLLLRTPDTSDRRQVQLQLSARGHQEFRQLRKTIESNLAARIALLEQTEKRALNLGLVALEELFRDA